jgi:hypothetical protein
MQQTPWGSERRGWPSRCGDADRVVSVVMTVLAVLMLGLPSGALGEVIDEPDAHVLELRKDPTIHRGRLAQHEGAATREGTWIKVRGLAIAQTVMVALHTDEKGPPMTIELRKFPWSGPLRTLSTDPTGEVRDLFRVQGDLFIRLIPTAAEQRFALLVWVDDKNDDPLPPVLVTKQRSGE